MPWVWTILGSESTVVFASGLGTAVELTRKNDGWCGIGLIECLNCVDIYFPEPDNITGLFTMGLKNCFSRRYQLKLNACKDQSFYNP